MIRGIRGATTVSENSVEAITHATREMLDAIYARNALNTDTIVTAFFTITPDVSAVSPAKVARTYLDWTEVPIMCAAEPFVEGLPERCIRILIQFETDQPPEVIHHVYLNEAVRLRPDRAE